MASVSVSDYKELYNKTARAYIEAMETNIDIVTTDLNNAEAVEVIYRSAHSLKGQSSLMGYKDVAALSEFVEKTMRKIKEQHISLDTALLAEIKHAVANIKAAVTKEMTM